MSFKSSNSKSSENNNSIPNDNNVIYDSNKQRIENKDNEELNKINNYLVNSSEESKNNKEGNKSISSESEDKKNDSKDKIFNDTVNNTINNDNQSSQVNHNTISSKKRTISRKETGKKKSSRTNIVCIDIDPKKRDYNAQTIQVNNNSNNFDIMENNVVIALKRKIKELNTELNRLRNDSNVQNYNILEMNYKLKNKELVELKQENNYFRFQLEEKKNRKGGSTTKLSKNVYFPTMHNGNKFFLNFNNKSRVGNLMTIPSHNNKMLSKSRKINIKIKEYSKRDDKVINKEENKNKEDNKEIELDEEMPKEEEDKDELIKTLKFENDKLRKLGNENYSLWNKIEELNKIKKENNLKIEKLSEDNEQLQLKYNELKEKNSSLNGEISELK